VLTGGARAMTVPEARSIEARPFPRGDPPSRSAH
jgi:hypothetical protein